jgi:hypothetical protein
MFKWIFAFLALAFSLFGTQCWAATCSSESAAPSCTNMFSPTDTTGTYEFFGDGKLIVKFGTVLTTFNLTVTVDHTIDPLDPNVFPAGTVCVKYAFNAGQCDEYDFTGNKSGPNGVPVKNIDYKGLITLSLEYSSFQTANTPAFGHAPGDNATAVYSEDILTGYSTFPVTGDPTMGGKLPGLSSVAALDEPLTENDTYCWVSPPIDGQIYTVGQTIEVSFRLFPSGPCTGNLGTPIRDKTARLSLSTTDTNGNVVFPPHLEKEEGNKFHWDNKDGVNEFDLSTEGLQPGTYTITVFSSKFSPQSRDVTLISRSGMVCLTLSGGVSCF